MSDLQSQGQFLWSQKLFHFTLFQRKKCTGYHFISNILLQICTFQNVYEQRQYWCSINAIAPRYFILKSFSMKIQNLFFFLHKFKRETERAFKCWPSVYHSRNQKPKFQTNITKTIYTSKLQPLVVSFFPPGTNSTWRLKTQKLTKMLSDLNLHASSNAVPKFSQLTFLFVSKTYISLPPFCEAERKH